MSAARPPAPAWRIFPTVMVRAAGMPIGMRDVLRSPASAAHAGARTAIDSRLRACASGLIAGLTAERHRRPADAACGDLRRAERRVRAGRPVADVVGGRLDRLVRDWNDLLGERAAAVASLEAAWGEEQAAVTAGLVGLLEREDVQEAIFVNSPDALAALRELGRLDPGGKRHRYLRRTLIRYVQRLGAKTETGGFFGPINRGSADRDAGPGLAVEVKGDGRAAVRRVTMSFWAAQALADRCAADPACAPLLRAYRSARPMPGAVDATTTALLRFADGRCSAARIASALGSPIEATVLRLRELEAQGQVRLGLWLPAASADPLAALGELLAGASGEAAERIRVELAWWRAWLASWAAGRLGERERLLPEGERRFTAATGLAARRGAGRMSGDRHILVEEAWGNIPSLTIGGELFERLTCGLSVALDVLASRAVGHRLQQRAAVVARLPERNVGPIPLDAVPPLAPVADEQWCSGWRTAIPDPAVPEVRLSRAELARAGLIRPDLDGWPLLCAPDVMIAAPDLEAVNRGDYQLVLSEAHHLLPPATLPFSAFDTGGEASLSLLGREMAELVAPAALALQAVWRRNKAMDFIPFGQPVVCLDWVRPEPRSTPVAASELAIEVAPDGRPTVTWTGCDRGELAIVPDYPDMEPELGGLRALAIPEVAAVPVELGVHTPRIVIEGLVFQRERWRFSAAGFPPCSGVWSAEAFAALWGWKETHALPDLAFVSADSETKPVLVDFRSAASCEVLVHLLRQSGSVAVTEMLPRPDQLWLRVGEDAFCCELRLTLLRCRSAAQGGGG